MRCSAGRPAIIWLVFLTLTAAHIHGNTRAMRALRLTSLNPPRLQLLVEHALHKVPLCYSAANAARLQHRPHPVLTADLQMPRLEQLQAAAHSSHVLHPASACAQADQPMLGPQDVAAQESLWPPFLEPCLERMAWLWRPAGDQPACRWQLRFAVPLSRAVGPLLAGLALALCSRAAAACQEALLPDHVLHGADASCASGAAATEQGHPSGG